MKKFLVIYHAPEEFSAKMGEVSAEQAKEEMGKWMEWAEKCGDKLVDMGTPLANGMSVTKDGSSKSKMQVAGFSVLKAESMEEAMEMLKEHPHLMADDSCSVEVHEEMPLPGM